MNLAKRIRTSRETLGLTQEELATATGLTPQYISLIEQDKRIPSVSSLTKLVEELGVTVDYLITGKENIITDIVVAVKADKTLNLETRRALITLVRALRDRADK